MVPNNKPPGSSDKKPHLGILRMSNCSNMDTVDSRIKAARQDIHGLLGAGFRGYNGSGPDINVLKYKTYVVPTFLYGIEALVLGKKETIALETYHRQSLPDTTALPAIY